MSVTCILPPPPRECRKKVTGKKSRKKSQIWEGKKVTGKKVTKKNYAFSQLLDRNKHFVFIISIIITLCFVCIDVLAFLCPT